MHYFDLFQLHDFARDKAPRSKIVCFGLRLIPLVQEMLREIYAHRERGEITRYFVAELGVSKVTEGCLRSATRKWLPLIFLQKLLFFWQSACEKTCAEAESKKLELFDCIESMRVNLNSSKPVSVPQHLTIQLCKIAGAHAADGTLADNFLCITDRNRESVVAFQQWIFESFGVKPKIVQKGPNEWKLAFHNKVITRYLKTFFGFPSGTKHLTVSEPQIIKDADLCYR